jgi:hypothetical protein
MLSNALGSGNRGRAVFWEVAQILAAAVTRLKMTFSHF